MTYTVFLKGESSDLILLYNEFGLDSICLHLENYTGYKSTFLRGELRGIEVNEEKTIRPANSFGVPCFIVRRVT